MSVILCYLTLILTIDDVTRLGVMTKPDMLPSGSTKALQLWLDIIEGRAHNLNHGYYCTLQPNDDQRSKSISSADARAAEKLFFQITLPWSRSTQLQRFGTGNLIAALSRLLVSVIDKTYVAPQLPRFHRKLISYACCTAFPKSKSRPGRVLMLA